MGSRILGLWISIWLGLKLKLNPTGAGAILFISEFFQQKRFVFLIVLSYDVNIDLRFGFYGANQRFEDRNSSISSKKEHFRRKAASISEDSLSQYQKGKIWLNGHWIAINSQKRVLSIIIISFQSSITCQKCCLSETEICHYSKTLIWRRWFPLQFGVELVLSFEYYIQSIKVYHVSKKHSKCPIWIISDIF